MAAKTFSQMGEIYDHFEYFTPAIQVVEQALTIHENMGAYQEQVFDLQKISHLYGRIGDYPKAYEYLKKALAVTTQAPDTLQAAYTSFKIGQNLWHQKNYGYAIPYFDRARTVFENLNLTDTLPTLYYYMGDTYQYLHYPDSAWQYLQLALASSKESGNRSLEVSTLIGLGHYYQEQGLLDHSAFHFLQAFELSGHYSFKRLKMTKGNVIPFVQGVFDSFEPYGELRGIRLHFISSKKEFIMFFDAEKMLRIISNLLSNAIKFTPKEGHIYCIIDSSPNKVGLSSGITIRIRDTGEGIAPDEIPYIFEQFYQAGDWINRNKKTIGTGIGLALCKELTQLMNGQIRVESEQGVGTTFSVYLPCIGTDQKVESVLHV